MLFTESKDAKKALIIVHGPGILRTELADLGFATLSVQMPVLAADVRGGAYRETYPEAV